jgi:uncharacterized protein (DUF2147 family)
MRNILRLFLIVFMAKNVVAQTTSDSILGTWYSPKKDGKVLIYKTEDKYFGKLIYLKNNTDANGNPLLDVSNKDASKRNQPIVGLVFLSNFTFNPESKRWKGQLYDYDGGTGNTYTVYIKITKNGKLNIRGFGGYSWFGLNPGLILSKVE